MIGLQFVLLVLAAAALPERRRTRQAEQEIANEMTIEMTMVELVGIAQKAIVAGGRAALVPFGSFFSGFGVEM